MLDIKFIRENPDIIKKDLEKRQDSEKIKWVDEFLKLDEEWRKLKVKIDNLRARRNKVSEEINNARKEKKNIDSLIKEGKEIPGKIKKIEEEQEKLYEKMTHIRMRLPNIMHESVPVGKDDSENQEIKKSGKIKKFDFKLKSHGELAEQLGIADFKRATKVSGAGFVYLKNELALLDLALQKFAIDSLMKKGYDFIIPPHMLNKEAYERTTDVESFENVMYKIDGDEAYMIATSEHPLMAMFKDEVMNEKNLPIKLVGVSPCYRREIGSHGVDKRGLFRMHQFNKVEQVVICKPEESWKYHEKIQKNTEELFDALKIPYRVVNICTGDLGSIAAKKYDIEAYSPREQKYFEVTSASNCTAYQTVRLNIRYTEGKERKTPHSLNNTAIATSRVMRAIFENYQNKDGTVTVPEVLIPYMNGLKIINLQQ